MGDVGDYWREHKEHKRVMHRKEQQYESEVARGERPHVCFLCKRAFKAEQDRTTHFDAKHVDMKR